MTVALNLDDMGYMTDFTETVTFVAVSADGAETSYANVTALGTMLSESVAQAGAQMTPQAANWHIRASTLAVKPARGDRIVSTSARMSGTWVVKECDVATLGTRYACKQCQKLLT